MKVAPFIRAIANYNSDNKHPKVEHVLVHTGQHYDIRMSEVFFRELSISEPDINLEIGSGSHAEQLGYTMIAFEKVLLEYKPDWVVVVGDVNATLSCSVAAKRLNIKVCHIEAGLRSGDMSMPEEINRLVTDRISDLLLTPDTISSANLHNEETPDHKIAFVCNIMIDTLEANCEKASALTLHNIINNSLSQGYNFKVTTPSDNSYAVITLHQPSNVDRDHVFVKHLNFFLMKSPEILQLSGLFTSVRKNNSKLLVCGKGYCEITQGYC
jgi:UDP-N-acetylglucosamine 2-epimerase (non-hydrolysing)